MLERFLSYRIIKVYFDNYVPKYLHISRFYRQYEGKYIVIGKYFIDLNGCLQYYNSLDELKTNIRKEKLNRILND
jgi:hypothetical protein